MAVTLNSTGDSNGFIIISDNTGAIALQTVSANSLVIGNNQVATFSSEGNANILIISGVGIDVTGIFNSTGNVTAPQFISNISTGNAPLVVTSTTVVANLNANALQGNTPSETATANSIVQRNEDGNITANFFIGNGSQLTGLSTSSISNGNSNIDIPSANGNINFNVGGNPNIAIITSTGLSSNIIEVADIYSNRTGIVVTSNTVIDSFGITEYRSAKYSIRVSDDTGYQAVEVLLIHNSINSYITIYGSLSMTNNDLVTLSSNVNGSNVELLATGLNSNTFVNLIGLYVPD